MNHIIAAAVVGSVVASNHMSANMPNTGIDRAFEIVYVDLAKSNKQRRMRRTFRAVDAHAAKFAFGAWKSEQFVQFGIQYHMLGTPSEVLATPTPATIASLNTVVNGRGKHKHAN